MVGVMVDVPHFAFPFQWRANGQARVVEQGSQAEVIQGVEVLVLTHRGERVEVPGFGIDDPSLLDDPDPEVIAAAALEWDDRAEVLFDGSVDETRALTRHLLTHVAHQED